MTICVLVHPFSDQSSLPATVSVKYKTEKQESYPEMTDSLKRKLSRFLKSDDFSLKAIPGGASARKYFQLSMPTNSYFPSNPVLLMTAPSNDRKSLSDYFNISYYLRRMGVATPRVYELQRRYGWIFMEYCAWPTVEEFLKNSPDKNESVLGAVIDFLIDMQKKCRPEPHCPAFQRRFDQAKFRFEFRFHFTEQLIEKFLGYRLTGTERSALDRLAQEISATLDTGEELFVHRDFQSSNLFIAGGSGNYRLQVIDFQDARAGTAAYDLISCLFDSYLAIRPEERERMMRYYLRQSELKFPAEFNRIIDYAVIQRKLHDAGAFAFNYLRTHNRRYLQYIPGALNFALDKMRKFSHFKEAAVALKHIAEASDDKIHLL